MMTIYKQQVLIKKAYDILLMANIDSFPIKVSKIMHYFKDTFNISFIKYSTLAKASGYSITGVAIQYGSNDAVLRYNPNNEVVSVIYNDKQPKERQRWNILHELSRFICDHHIIRYKVESQNLSLSKYQIENMEAEANFLTKVILAPIDFVLYCAGNYHCYDAQRIFVILKAIFRLSTEASFYYSNSLLSPNVRNLLYSPISKPLQHSCDTFFKNYDANVFSIIEKRYEKDYEYFKNFKTYKSLGIEQKHYPEQVYSILERVLYGEGNNLS